MISKVTSAALVGIDGLKVDVEIDISKGLPSFTTVGLAEGAVRESKDRVKAALKNQGLPFPRDRVTVNLAPANIRKDGAGFDLPMAIGLLAAQNLLEISNKIMLVGELGLDGSLKTIKGALPIAMAAKNNGYEELILPLSNAYEAAAIHGLTIRPAENLVQVFNHLAGKSELAIYNNHSFIEQQELFQEPELDLKDVKGQDRAKRALIVAAAGGHNLLLIGPPGGGKTMLSQRLPGILPPLSFEEAIETSKIYSAMALMPENQAIITTRPFRSPHHTISEIGLIGGGRYPRPGEASLSHNGVLFLDELPEFKKSVLEVLRQPLEDGKVSISRSTMSLTFPSRFMMVAAMNPCPCGYLTDSHHKCRCSPKQIQNYRNHVSGPLLDRIDLHIETPAVSFKDLNSQAPSIDSKTASSIVKKAREIQRKRFQGEGIYVNAQMSEKHLKKWGRINDEAMKLMEMSVEKLGLSARAYSRVIKLARTIADLNEQEEIQKKHLAEAISYRTLDRSIV